MTKRIFMQAPNGEVFETSNPEYHNECVRLSATEGKKARAAYCADKLRSIVKPGDTVYCTLRHVSSSGMTRHISLHVIESKGGKPYLRSIDQLAADSLGYRIAAHGGLVVSGCGMDMGFHLVYSLGCAIWPKGTDQPHGMRNGEPDFSGGYALKSEWI